jgi:hypothetical protein
MTGEKQKTKKKKRKKGEKLILISNSQTVRGYWVIEQKAVQKLGLGNREHYGIRKHSRVTSKKKKEKEKEKKNIFIHGVHNP